MVQTTSIIPVNVKAAGSSSKDPRSDQILASTLAQVRNIKNRHTIERYLAEKRINGVKNSSLASYVKPLRSLSEFLGDMLFEDVKDKEPIAAFLGGLKRQAEYQSTRRGRLYTFKGKPGDLSPAFVNFHKMTLKNFYRWLRQTPAPGFPPEVAWLKVKNPANDPLAAEKYIPPEQFAKILAHSGRTPRDTALFSLLYASGFRISEALALNIENVRFEPNGAVLTLPAEASSLKTGQRVVKIFPDDGSVKMLHDWFEAHAFNTNRKAPLFYSISDRNKFGRLSRSGAYQKFIRNQRLAGIEEPWTEHDLRHSAATNDGKRGMPPQFMEKKYGWKPGSRMVARYTHLSPEDYIKNEEISRGYRKPDEAGFIGLKSRKCPRCQEHNLPSQVYCGKCREPLSDEARRNATAERNEELAQVIREEVQKALAAGLMR